MPKYKIQLKQGKRTIVAHGEFKSVQSALNHYNRISTMKVSEISKIEYEDTTTPPVDDFNYRSQFKGIIKNDENRISKQVIFNNIKSNINEQDIYNSCISNMEIDNHMIDSMSCSLFKK